jgi:hypothetical protein
VLKPVDLEDKMAFDPSAIQDIGTQPDYGGAMAKGFQLKDLIDQNQMSQLRLNSLKSEQSDNAKAKSILSTSDLQTEKGLAEASEKLTKAGLPEKAMDLRKYGQSVTSGELDIQKQKVQLHVEAQSLITDKVDGLWAAATQMKEAKTPDGRPKYTDASINAFISGQIPGMLNDIQTSDLPDQVKKTALSGIAPVLQKSGSQITYDQLTQFEQATKSGRDQLIQHQQQLLGQRKEATSERTEAERERHDQRMEDLTATNPNRAAPSAGSGDLLAALTAKGVTLPQGLRSKQVLMQTLDGLKRKYPNLSDDEIADQVKSGAIEMGVSKTEGSVLGRREAAILPVEKSITKPGGFLDQAEKAVNAVDFSKLKAAGAFEKWGKDQLSDPALSRYKAAVAELRAEYSIVLSKGGQVTDAARHESEKVIPDLITKEQFQTIKQVVKQGIEASKGGVEESIAGVTGGKQPAADTKTVNWDDLK